MRQRGKRRTGERRCWERGDPAVGRARPPGRRVPAEQRPDLSQLPDDPGVYIFRDERGRPLYVGKSVSLRTRARSHFCAPAGWTERAEVVDYRPTNSELGALVLENRLIKQWLPAGNRQLKRTDRWVYLRCRLDIPYPVLEVSAEPAAGHAVSVGPLRGRRLAGELADHLSSLFKLRHCGRAMKRREHPSIYGQMGRCCSPCLGDLDPNAYRRQIDTALALFDGSEAAEDLLLADIDRRIADASAARRYEAAAALLRRRERLAGLLERLGGVLRAVHADPRLVLAPHPSKSRFDAFWIVGGRVADWGRAARAGGDPATNGGRTQRREAGRHERSRRGGRRGADRLGVAGRARAAPALARGRPAHGGWHPPHRASCRRGTPVAHRVRVRGQRGRRVVA